jgi:thiol-disulfide isomerase/thioredoxin
MVYFDSSFAIGRLLVALKKVIIVCAVLVFIVVTVTKCGQKQRQEAAPNFKLRNLAGREVSLNQFKGKVVLLDFWATWCGPCQMSMPLIEKLQKENPGKVTVLAINLGESADSVREYVRSQNIESEVLLDEDSAVGSAYGAGAIPYQVLIDKQGIIRRVQEGVGPDTIAGLQAAILKLQ